MNTYNHLEWFRFREEVIKLDGGQCVRCGRSRADGAVLQVHHKSYTPGRLPWEYGHTECETLCKGCHAQQHGIIMPQSDWALIATDDLGDLCGECDYCGTEIRYVFAITHPKWGAMAVGTDCCDRLTLTHEASEYHAKYTKARERRARFLTSKRWKWRSDAWWITQRSIKWCIAPYAGKFRISMEGVAGRGEYDTLVDAKLKVYDLSESGEAAAFLERHRHRARLRHQEELAKARASLHPKRSQRRVFSYYC